MKKFVLMILAVLCMKTAMALDVKEYNHNVKNYNKNIFIYDSQKNLRAKFLINVADDDEKRAYGLMNLRSLPKEMGMLFLFEKRDMIYMWMKNTLIPLDMIFIDENKIISIHRNAKPLDLTAISSQKKVDKVLEINSGIADQFKIEVGDVVVIK